MGETDTKRRGGRRAKPPRIKSISLVSKMRVPGVARTDHVVASPGRELELGELGGAPGVWVSMRVDGQERRIFVPMAGICGLVLEGQ